MPLYYAGVWNLVWGKRSKYDHVVFWRQQFQTSQNGSLEYKFIMLNGPFKVQRFLIGHMFVKNNILLTVELKRDNNSVICVNS